jgi:fructose-1,6-bisphosphatase/inositol monophosphatase family enzyme
VARLRDEDRLLALLREIHEHIRDEVVARCERTAADQLATVAGREGGDTIYAVDRIAERSLLEHFSALSAEWPCLLIAEGLGPTGRAVLPAGTREEDVEIVVLVDPIDGTRGLMFQKRSAWILTGVAPHRAGITPTLANVRLAVQTEIPLVKQHLSDAAWAIEGQGAAGERTDRLTGRRSPLALTPSTATTVAHGFGGLAKFFSGTRGALAAIDDAVVARLLGAEATSGEALVFDDQYISTGGQLFELMTGKDRWVADVRPLLVPELVARGERPPLCAHPYDLATELVAREAGVIVADPWGRPLGAPLDVETNVAWVAFANRALADAVGAALEAELAARGLL